jgi:hypothetical protein
MIAVQELNTEKAEEIAVIFGDCIYAGLMMVYALAFDDVPPWGPDEYRDNLREGLRQKRRSTN